MPIDPNISLAGRPVQFDSANIVNLFAQGQARRMAMESHQQQMQSGALELQQHQMALDQTKALNDAYQGALTVGADGTPTIDKGKLTDALGKSGHGAAIPGVLKNLTDFEVSTADLAKKRGEVANMEQDYAGSVGAAIKAANNDPRLFLTKAQHAINSKAVDPQMVAPLIQQVNAKLQEDPSGESARALVGQISDQFIAQSPAQQKLINEGRTSQAAADSAAARVTGAQNNTTRLNAELPEIRLKSAVLQKGQDASNLAAVLRQSGPQAYAAALRQLPPDRQAPFAALTGAAKPEDVLAIGMNPHEQATTIETAKRDAATALNEAAMRAAAAGHLGIAQKEYELKKLTFDKTYGDGANTALVGVLPAQRNGALSAAQKAADEYTKAMESTANMQSILDLAKSGNKVAYAYAPTTGVLTINTANGVKRVNMAEIKAYGGAGSAFDALEGFLGKQATGASIPKDILDNMGAVNKTIADNAGGTYNAKLDGINQNFHSNFKPVGAAKAPASGGALSTGHKVGEVVTVGGKKYKISKLLPNDKFEADEVNQ